MDALSRLNEQGRDAASEDLRRCCGSSRWVEGMLARRPFASPSALFAAADEVWTGLAEADWREAFTHHPRIGDMDSLRARFATTRTWAANEQAGVQEAGDDVLAALADGNRAYEARFGYIFIVCATGLSAQEMLVRLQERLSRDPASEIRIAAAEQAKITRLRLQKLLGA
jgi:2-oxo-4-hydroxy-4-carboxy-5-ureidoimidazoline decarboxylase